VSIVGLDVVTCGWELPGWDRDFYPDDLPVDWRLAYFANEFPAAMVSRERWVAAGEASLVSWSQDVPEDFRFYLIDSDVTVAHTPRECARRALGVKLAGLVFETGTTAPLPEASVARFRILDEPVGVRVKDSLPAWRIPRCCVRDLRSGRAWLESVVARRLNGRGLLVLPSDNSDIEDLRRWWQLVWLLSL
jgi:hypothetical protein